MGWFDSVTGWISDKEESFLVGSKGLYDLATGSHTSGATQEQLKQALSDTADQTVTTATRVVGYALSPAAMLGYESGMEGVAQVKKDVNEFVDDAKKVLPSGDTVKWVAIGGAALVTIFVGAYAIRALR